MVQDAYGAPRDVLRLERVAPPVVRPDEVLVRVAAARVDRGVWHLVAGLPYPVRLAGYGVRAPKHRVPGMALAGRVEAVGDDVTTLRVGDAVYGVGQGAYAELSAAKASALAPAPPSLTAVEAAAVPVSGVTALQALRDHGQVQPGQRVLVIGASGGVGTFAVQVAKALGAHVTGVCSAGKADLVRALGADDVLDRAAVDLAPGERYDVVVDTGGQRPLRQLRRALTPRGRLVIVGSETGGRWLGGTDRQLCALALSPFLRQRLGTFVSSDTTDDLMALHRLVEAGTVRPAVDRVFGLHEAVDALQHLLDGRVRGKVVLEVHPDVTSAGPAVL